jgi:hypothetical protein
MQARLDLAQSRPQGSIKASVLVVGGNSAVSVVGRNARFDGAQQGHFPTYTVNPYENVLNRRYKLRRRECNAKQEVLATIRWRGGA